MHQASRMAVGGERPSPWVPRLLFGLTALHLLALFLHLPLFRSFYPYAQKPLGDPLSLGLIVLAGGTLLALLRSRWSGWRYLLGLVLVGIALQHGFALTEGRGFQALRDRTVLSGHAEFAILADQTADAFAVTRDYEALARQEKLGRFAPSKPPGTLLLYVWTDRAAKLLGASGPAYDAIAAVWPVFAAAAVVPLYFLARLLFGTAAARLAAAFYIAVPSVNLILLHTDQVFFPSLFAACLLALVAALRRQSAGRGYESMALAAGAVVYGAAFFQLPLALSVTVAFGIALAERWSREDRAKVPMRLIEFHVLVAVGFVLAAVLPWLWLNYDPMVRYAGAISFHGSLKGARANMAVFGFSNLIEFACWTGLPLMVLAVSGVWRSWRWPLRADGDADRLIGLAGSLVLLLLYFAFLTRTASEVARIWIFLVPLVCILAARGAALLGWDARSRPVAVLLGLQLLTVYAIKINQDFY